MEGHAELSADALRNVAAGLGHGIAPAHADHQHQPRARGLRAGVGRDRTNRHPADAALCAGRPAASNGHQPRQRCQRHRARHRSRRPARPAARDGAGFAGAWPGALGIACLLCARHRDRPRAGLAWWLADPGRGHRCRGGSDGLFRWPAADLLHTLRRSRRLAVLRSGGRGWHLLPADRVAQQRRADGSDHGRLSRHGRARGQQLPRPRSRRPGRQAHLGRVPGADVQPLGICGARARTLRIARRAGIADADRRRRCCCRPCRCRWPSAWCETSGASVQAPHSMRCSREPPSSRCCSRRCSASRSCSADQPTSAPRLLTRQARGRRAQGQPPGRVPGVAAHRASTARWP